MLDTVHYEKNVRLLSCYKEKVLLEYPHFHTQLEMIVCFSGKANCFLGERNFDFGAGDIILVFPNQPHQYRMIEKGDFLVITFCAETIPNMKSFFKRNLPERTKVNFSESDRLKELFLSLKNNYEISADDSETLLIGYLNIAMYLLKPLIGANLIGNISSGNFEKILSYCINHYREKITLKILSDKLHLSAQRISHIFNENMSITIPQYVNFLRISEACRLLAETDDPISKIFSEVGFESPQTFSRAFYQVMKMNPKQFREGQEK